MSGDASTSSEKQGGDDESSTAAAASTTGNKTEGADTTDSKGKEPEETNEEMRARLDVGRKELRVWLERKKKVDRDLVSCSPSHSLRHLVVSMLVERVRMLIRRNEQAALEVSIHAFEGSYLSDALLPPSTTTGATTSGPSHQFGNIIKGYDSYLKAASGGGSSGALGGGSDRKRGLGKAGEEPKESDRMFSNSSTTYKKVRPDGISTLTTTLKPNLTNP